MLKETRIVELDEVIVPDYMYLAWETNDYTGLNDEEIKDMKDFFGKYKGCTFEEDVDRKGFRRRNDVNNMGGECVVLRVFGEIEEPIKESISVDLKKKVKVTFNNINDMLDFYNFLKEEEHRVKILCTNIRGKYVEIDTPTSFIEEIKNGFDCSVMECLHEDVHLPYDYKYYGYFPLDKDGNIDCKKIVSKLKECIIGRAISANDLSELLLDDKKEETRISMYLAREFLFDNKDILYTLCDEEYDITDSDVPSKQFCRKTIKEYVDTYGDEDEISKILIELLERMAKDNEESALMAICQYLADDFNELPWKDPREMK